MTDAWYMLDTNIFSDLFAIRKPQWSKIVEKRQPVHQHLTAAELRYGGARKSSPRLLKQVEAIQGNLESFRSTSRLTSNMAASVQSLRPWADQSVPTTS